MKQMALRKYSIFYIIFATSLSWSSSIFAKPKFGILLFGDSGAGKSTMVNAFANHILLKDEIIGNAIYAAPISKANAYSVTQKTTFYHLEGEEVDLEVIDTRGFNSPDISNEVLEDRLLNDIRGQEIHAIVLVIKSSVNRLTPQMQNLLKVIKSICPVGKKFSKFVRVFVTGGDSIQFTNVRPSVLDSLPIPDKYFYQIANFAFCFDHSKLNDQDYCESNLHLDGGDNFERQLATFCDVVENNWFLTKKSLNEFFSSLNIRQTVSIKALIERKQKLDQVRLLKETIEALQSEQEILGEEKYELVKSIKHLTSLIDFEGEKKIYDVIADDVVCYKNTKLSEVKWQRWTSDYVEDFYKNPIKKLAWIVPVGGQIAAIVYAVQSSQMYPYCEFCKKKAEDHIEKFTIIRTPNQRRDLLKGKLEMNRERHLSNSQKIGLMTSRLFVLEKDLQGGGI